VRTLVIVVACGKEEQLASGTDTAFLSLGNRPVIAHSLDIFQKMDEVDGIIIATGKDRIDSAVQLIRRFGYTKICGIIAGGSGRLTTLRTVFSKLPEEANIVLIHESSRPFIHPKVIQETLKAARRYGSAIAAHRIPNAVKVAENGLKVKKTLGRNSAWETQSPQAFKFDLLQKIIASKGINLVDDESEWVRKPHEVHLVESGRLNMKIRTAEDLKLAVAIFNTGLKQLH
jgi:2-C-methyl-D-erythritol 4-phosphate cytidylyltransferase